MTTQRTTSLSCRKHLDLNRQVSLPFSSSLAHKPRREDLQFHGVLVTLKLKGILEVISSKPVIL